MALPSSPAVRTPVIVGGNRTPFAKAGGAYASASNTDLLTAALDGLVARFGLAGRQLDEVAAGAVLKHSRDFNLTREAVLGSALAATTPAVDLQQACGTGLEAVIYIANKIALGQADEALALQQHVVAVREHEAPGHPETAAAHVQQAQIVHALGRPEEAVQILEAALPILESAPVDYHGRRGLGRYTLARCLAELRQDQPRQQLLATLAADDLAAETGHFARRAMIELTKLTATKLRARLTPRR